MFSFLQAKFVTEGILEAGNCTLHARGTSTQHIRPSLPQVDELLNKHDKYPRERERERESAQIHLIFHLIEGYFSWQDEDLGCTEMLAFHLRKKDINLEIQEVKLAVSTRVRSKLEAKCKHSDKN